MGQNTLRTAFIEIAETFGESSVHTVLRTEVIVAWMSEISANVCMGEQTICNFKNGKMPVGAKSGKYLSPANQ